MFKFRSGFFFFLLHRSYKSTHLFPVEVCFTSWCEACASRLTKVLKTLQHYTPNANMADRSVAAWNELHESEASQASVFCFDNAFIVKSWLFVDLVCFFSLLLRVAVFLNATRSDRSVHSLSLREKWINAISCDEREEFAIATGTIEVCSLHFKLEDLRKFV